MYQYVGAYLAARAGSRQPSQTPNYSYMGEPVNKYNNFAESLKKNWWVYLLLIVAIFNYKKIVGFFKQWGINEQNNKYSSKEYIYNVTKGKEKYVLNLVETAQTIYSAFYEQMWGMSEDEKVALGALNRVPKSLIPILAGLYSEIGDVPKSIYDDFRKFLNTKDYATAKKLLF